MPDENKGFGATKAKIKAAYKTIKPPGLEVWTVQNHLKTDISCSRYIEPALF